MKSYVFLYKYRAYNMQNCSTVQFFLHSFLKRKLHIYYTLFLKKVIVLLCRRQINLYKFYAYFLLQKTCIKF